MYEYYKEILLLIEEKRIPARRGLSMLNRKARQLGYFAFRYWLYKDR